MAKQQNKRTLDNTAWNIGKLETERNTLLVSKSNPERLKEVIALLDYFNWGIK